MVFDSDRGQIVMFGGVGPSGVRNDTWLWNGTAWTQATPANSPSARWCQGMAYDEQRHEVVLFGGSGLNDTWTWDGTNWAKKTPANSPSPRSCAVMAYDPVRKQTILYSGYGPSSEFDSQTW